MKDIKKYFKTRIEKGWNVSSVVFAVFAAVSILGLVVFGEEVSIVVSNYESVLVNNMFFIAWFGYLALLVYSFLTIRYRNQVAGIVSDERIHSLKSKERQEGSLGGVFFLGFGGVSGRTGVEDYLVFYKEGEFGLVKEKLLASEVEVIMRDDVEPSLKWICVEGKERQFLFVPKNTVKKEIVIET